MNMLAAISGDALIDALVQLFIWGVIMWVLWWGLHKIAPPEPWMKVGTVILVLITVLVLINILLGIGGKPLIKFSIYDRAKVRVENNRWEIVPPVQITYENGRMHYKKLGTENEPILFELDSTNDVVIGGIK